MSFMRKLGLASLVVVAAFSLAATAASAGTYKLSTSANSSSPPTSLTAEISEGTADLTDNAGAPLIECPTFTVDSQGGSLSLSGGGDADGQTPSGVIHAASWAGCVETILGTACTGTAKTFPWAVTVIGDGSQPSAPKLRVAEFGAVFVCPSIGVTCRADVPESGFLEAKVTHLSSPLSATFNTNNPPTNYSNLLPKSEPSSAICPDPGRFTASLTFTGETDPNTTKVALKLTAW